MMIIAKICYVDRYEKNNHIISKDRKQAQKEHRSRPDWVGMGIYWELCKGFKFDMLTSGISANQNPPSRIRRIKFSEV